MFVSNHSFRSSRQQSIELYSAGFTLIEMAVVLVIIGLIVGGVLVGQDLIRAAYVRATISQVEKFNTAVNTFYGKYQALPGDMNASAANTYGFAVRGQYPGEGDGNGIIEGTCNPSGASSSGISELIGETLMFWVDLSSSTAGHLISGGFISSASINNWPSGGIPIDGYLPAAKLGGGNYFSVWSGGINGGDGKNYYGLAYVSLLGGCGGPPQMFASIPVYTAYTIDMKLDDGFPQSGNVMAILPGDLTVPVWAYGGSSIFGASTGTAASPSAATCYDNGGNATALMAYSVGTNHGAGGNCALSFKMQGGD